MKCYLRHLNLKILIDFKSCTWAFTTWAGDYKPAENRGIFRRNIMKTDKYTSFEQLPLMLNAEQIASVLGISRANAYCLLHRKDFPTLYIGKRMVVPKDKLLEWIDENCWRK